MITKKASELAEGDHVEMEPVYIDFEETDTGDYLVTESEYGHVETIERIDGEDAVMIGFSNLSTWKLPADYALTVDDDVKLIIGESA